MMRKVVIVMDRKSKQNGDFLGVRRKRRKIKINNIIIFHVYFCSHKEKPGRQ